MQYRIAHHPIASDCLVIGLMTDVPNPKWIDTLPITVQHLVTKLSSRLTEAGDMLTQSDTESGTLVLIQCGAAASFDLDALNAKIAEIQSTLKKLKIKNACVALPIVKGFAPNSQAEHLILGFEYKNYQFQELKSTPKESPISEVTFVVPGAEDEVVDIAMAVSAGIQHARRLGNLPANICTPEFLAEEAKSLEKISKKIKVKVLGAQAIQDMGMNAFWSVAKGSAVEPRLIEIEYNNTQEKAPIVLIGKGITFDSGGISIKPSAGMEEMKFDMCGAASVLGAIEACARLDLPIHVIGLLACAENMPSATASKPGDVVKTMSGITVEITNTDAEGRLVLADTLTYAKKFNPAFVLDIATLTGAMIISLGYVNTGYMTEDEALSESILKAAQEANDKAWRLPLQKAYQESIESPVADILNSTGDRAAGSITAACFLSRFAKDMRWAHLDIAGTAWLSGKNRQSTGRPVPLLTMMLRHAAQSR